jgi:hypothetical protein
VAQPLKKRATNRPVSSPPNLRRNRLLSAMALVGCSGLEWLPIKAV